MLHKNGNASEIMLAALLHNNCFIINQYKVNKSQFEIMVNTILDWNKLGRKGSNINEFFEILDRF